METLVAHPRPHHDVAVDLGEFAARLRRLMAENGLNNQRLIAKLGGEVGDRTITRWTKGEHAPEAENLYRLADVFDVSMDYLAGRTDWDGRERRDPPDCAGDERRGPRSPSSPDAGDPATSPPAPHRRPRRRSA